MPPMITQLRQSKFLSLMAKAALTLAAFWLVMRGVDLAHLRVMLLRQNPALVASALALVIVQMGLGALRWRMILSAITPAGQAMMTRREALRIYYISSFFSCCLPGAVGGDVVRVFLARSDHVSLPLSIHSVIIDRLIALIALGVMVLLTLPLLGKVMGFNALPLLPPITLAAILGLWAALHIDKWLSKWRNVYPVAWVLYLTGSLRMLLARPGVSILSLIFALIAHSCFCLCGYLLAESLNIQITLLQCLTFIPLILLAVTLPVSIGGWGVREAGMVALLALIGVPQAPALMLSVQLGLASVIISLPAGLLWLAYRGGSQRSA
ncbi:MAG: flippase-like domain-containing protein [Pseudomonadota bacterium]|nr:flippase-like domain-containing protein [Pseudomonadota bacterium]